MFTITLTRQQLYELYYEGPEATIHLMGAWKNSPTRSACSANASSESTTPSTSPTICPKEKLVYVWGRLASLRRRIKVATPAERFEQGGFILLDAKYKACSYPGRLSLFRAARQQYGFNPDPFSGWKGVAALGVAVYDVPGDHLSILKEPCVRALAEKLDHSLA